MKATSTTNGDCLLHAVVEERFASHDACATSPTAQSRHDCSELMQANPALLPVRGLPSPGPEDFTQLIEIVRLRSSRRRRH